MNLIEANFRRILFDFFNQISCSYIAWYPSPKFNLNPPLYIYNNIRCKGPRILIPSTLNKLQKSLTWCKSKSKFRPNSSQTNHSNTFLASHTRSPSTKTRSVTALTPVSIFVFSLCRWIRVRDSRASQIKQRAQTPC